MLKSSALAIPSDEGRLGEVREFVSRFCNHAGLAERGAANLRLAVDQVCSLTMQHAYRNRSGELRIELDADKGWIEVRVRETGQALKGVNGPRDLAAWLDVQARRDASSVQLKQLVDRLAYTAGPNGNVWQLRKKMPARPRFQGGLRARYAVRSALVLGALVTVACVPLWILEGNRHRESEVQALQALAFGLVEAARPALASSAAQSAEQSRLQDTVMATRRRETRLLTVHVIDK
jgi:anti-sigma regulatory factor (Ser/Thr protein kinase)